MTTTTPKASFPSNIDIAQQAKMRPIVQIARDRLGIPEEQLEPYGRFKAKVSLDYVRQLDNRPNGKLVLVTAISPTPAGEGKTTTTVGLGDALNHIGKKAIICLREPALGPVFGMKGGAAGGGYSQVVPMEDINLHFTGDFSAIALANNLLAALIDNHIHQGNQLGFDIRRIAWRRVVDCNDRALRDIVIGLGGTANGYPREDGFDIVDIREPHELRETPTPSAHARSLPMAELLHGQPPFKPTRKTVLVCATGRRSLAATQELRENGITDVYSLRGGVKGLQARLFT